jgi:hypothetical protein
MYIAASLTLVLALVCFILLMEMYDVAPNNWGPQGVEFEEWHRVWRAHRDRYGLLGIASLSAFVVLLLVGSWCDLNRSRRLTRG